MAFSEKPPKPPPFDALSDPAVLYQYIIALLAYLERMRASIP